MALHVRQALSFYEILGPSGAGAMVEVHRSQDTRLERRVALTVLPEALADDEERLRCFDPKATTLASLNQPISAQGFEIFEPVEAAPVGVSRDLLPCARSGERS